MEKHSVGMSAGCLASGGGTGETRVALIDGSEGEAADTQIVVCVYVYVGGNVPTDCMACIS